MPSLIRVLLLSSVLAASALASPVTRHFGGQFNQPSCSFNDLVVSGIDLESLVKHLLVLQKPLARSCIISGKLFLNPAETLESVQCHDLRPPPDIMKSTFVKFLKGCIDVEKEDDIIQGAKGPGIHSQSTKGGGIGGPPNDDGRDSKGQHNGGMSNNGDNRGPGSAIGKDNPDDKSVASQRVGDGRPLAANGNNGVTGNGDPKGSSNGGPPNDSGRDSKSQILGDSGMPKNGDNRGDGATTNGGPSPIIYESVAAHEGNNGSADQPTFFLGDLILNAVAQPLTGDNVPVNGGNESPNAQLQTGNNGLNGGSGNIPALPIKGLVLPQFSSHGTGSDENRKVIPGSLVGDVGGDVPVNDGNESPNAQLQTGSDGLNGGSGNTPTHDVIANVANSSAEGQFPDGKESPNAQLQTGEDQNGTNVNSSGNGDGGEVISAQSSDAKTPNVNIIGSDKANNGSEGTSAHNIGMIPNVANSSADSEGQSPSDTVSNNGNNKELTINADKGHTVSAQTSNPGSDNGSKPGLSTN